MIKKSYLKPKMLIKNLSNLIHKIPIFYFTLTKTPTKGNLTINFIRKFHNESTHRENISLQEMQKKIEDLMYDIRIKYTQTYLKSYRNSNAFERVINYLFSEIERKTDLDLFDFFSRNFKYWKELESILIACVKTEDSKKTNTSLDISAENFIDTKLIQVFHVKQIVIFNSNIEIENFYYNLIQSYYDHLFSKPDENNIKLSVLEGILSSLITHFESSLTISNLNEVENEDISNRIIKTNEILKKRLPASIFQNFYSSFNILILRSMLCTKNESEKAFEIVDKELNNFINLKSTDQLIPHLLIRSLLISSICFHNDLTRFEYIINKIVEFNDSVYPVHTVFNLKHSIHKILFLKIKNSVKKTDINLILKSWSNIDYIPSVEIVNGFKEILNKCFKNENSNFIFNSRIDSE